MAAFSKICEGNERLGVARQYSDFSAPIGITVFPCTATMTFLAITYYLAEIYQITVSPEWFALTGLVCVVVAFAVPPVSGGVLICLNLLMNYLNIPVEGLALGGTLALLIDFFATGTKIVAIQMEIVIQADHFNKLDTSKLRSK